jgi:hypothetical protein
MREQYKSNKIKVKIQTVILKIPITLNFNYFNVKLNHNTKVVKRIDLL